MTVAQGEHATLVDVVSNVGAIEKIEESHSNNHASSPNSLLRQLLPLHSGMGAVL